MAYGQPRRGNSGPTKRNARMVFSSAGLCSVVRHMQQASVSVLIHSFIQTSSAVLCKYNTAGGEIHSINRNRLTEHRPLPRAGGGGQVETMPHTGRVSGKKLSVYRDSQDSPSSEISKSLQAKPLELRALLPTIFFFKPGWTDTTPVFNQPITCPVTHISFPPSWVHSEWANDHMERCWGRSAGQALVRAFYMY